VREFAPFLVKLGPARFRRKLAEWTPHKGVQKVKDISDVMHKTAQDILEQKREEIARDDTDDKAARGKAKDIISILRKSFCLYIYLFLRFDVLIPVVRANEQAKAQNSEQLSDLELTGQMTYVFLFDFVIRYRRRLTDSSSAFVN
jgi:hypothetical protein